MAMSKSDYDKTLTEKELLQADKIEGAIDEWLADRPGNLSFSVPPKISNRVRAEIEERYKAVGWKVEFISDQRDGNFWKFS
jgi:hypothetical protein